MNREKLIEDNQKLVWFVLHNYYPSYVHDEDIVQCGMLGLCKAANKWDETKSTFSNYAVRCIKSEILLEFRRRKKHKGVLSLDYPINDNDITFGDVIVGDMDVNYIDFDSLYDPLNEKQQLILDLLRAGESLNNIAKQLGVNRQTVVDYVRTMKKTWNKWEKEI